MSILVVGAIHHDVIVDAPALPRLDETLVGSAVRYAFGGKGGNQAVAAAHWASLAGIPVGMAACIGADEAGQSALATLSDAGVGTHAVQQINGPTGMSVAISLPDGGYGAVIVSGSNQQLRAGELELPADLQWLVLQNELPETINLAIAEQAKAAGARVLLNAAPARSSTAELVELVDCLVVNRLEAADVLGIAVEEVDADSAKALASDWDAYTIITLGGEGLWVCDACNCAWIEAHRVSVASTHGAGDAFVGALVAQLSSGSSLDKAAVFANAAAAYHVSRSASEAMFPSAGILENQFGIRLD